MTTNTKPSKASKFARIGLVAALVGGVGVFASTKLMGSDCCYAGASCCKSGGSACCKGGTGAHASM